MCENKRDLDSEVSSIWKMLFENRLTHKELVEYMRKSAQIEVATLHINHRCNLRCKHCFYSKDKTFESELTVEELISVIDQLLEIGVRHFHIAGREPFYDNKVIPILHYLQKLKDDGRELKYGIITNGTLIYEFIDQISQIELDYLDFSVDGLENENDFLRGLGSFRRTLQGLQLALTNKLAKKIYVSSVVHSKNYNSLLPMIKYLHKLGVRDFFVQPMVPLGRAKKLQHLVLSEELYSKLIFQSEKFLEGLNKKSSATITLFIYPTFFHFLYINNEYVRDSFMQFLSEHETELSIKSSTLDFEYHLSCLAHWRMCQITADGFYIGCSMMLSSEDYRKFSVGNVRKTAISDLYKMSLGKKSFMSDIIKSYNTVTCKNDTCFTFCNGGCRIASRIEFGTWNCPDPICAFWRKALIRGEHENSKDIQSPVRSIGEFK